MNLLGISLPTSGMQFTGWMVTIVGFTIVIVTLIILYIVFSWISKIINKNWKEAFRKKPDNKVVKLGNVDDNVAVAIAMALYLSKDIHDKEPDEITIERIQRRYSPWSAKLYGMNGKI